MSRKLQTKVSVFQTTLKPSTPDFYSIAKKEAAYKERQRNNYDRWHAMTDGIPIIKTGDSVWIRDMQRSGEVISTTRSPRSYLIGSPQGIIGRNRTTIINTSPGEADTPVTLTPRQSQGATRLVDTPITVTPRQSQGTTRLAAQMPSTPCSTVQPQQQSPSPCCNHNVSGQQFTRYGRRIVKPVKLDL